MIRAFGNKGSDRSQPLSVPPATWARPGHSLRPCTAGGTPVQYVVLLLLKLPMYLRGHESAHCLGWRTSNIGSAILDSLSPAGGRTYLRCGVECGFRDNEMRATNHACDWPILALDAALGDDRAIKG